MVILCQEEVDIHIQESPDIPLFNGKINMIPWILEYLNVKYMSYHVIKSDNS